VSRRYGSDFAYLVVVLMGAGLVAMAFVVVGHPFLSALLAFSGVVKVSLATDTRIG